jgi:hypothetical protein
MSDDENPGHRPCPFCAELIRPSATLCRFCGRSLLRGWAERPAFRSTPRRARWKPSPRGFLLILLAIFVIAIFRQNKSTSPPPETTTAPTRAETTNPCKTFAEPLRIAVQEIIRDNGYDCTTVEAICPYILSEGYTVYCNHLRYTYEIENHGGQWRLKPP